MPKGKKEKRPRSNDIPTNPCPEARDQNKQYLLLQERLRCTAHSTEGRTVYCDIDSGGHREVTHEQMTLWAKLIVSQSYNAIRTKTHQFKCTGKTDLKHPPNTKSFDYPATKKPKTRAAPASATPEFHISVKISPTPGASDAALQGSYVVSDSPIVKAQPPSAPAEVSNTVAGDSPPTNPPASRFSPTTFLLDCVFAERIPLVGEFFNLMEHDKVLNVDDPVYVEALSELHDHDIKDVVNLYSLGASHLATFGSMGRVRANLLLKYAKDRVLCPLGLVETTRSESSDPSVVEVDAPKVEVQEGPGWATIKEEHEDIINWLGGIEDNEEEEDEDVDELEGTDDEGDVASSGYSGRRSESFEV